MIRVFGMASEMILFSPESYFFTKLMFLTRPAFRAKPVIFFSLPRTNLRAKDPAANFVRAGSAGAHSAPRFCGQKTIFRLSRPAGTWWYRALRSDNLPRITGSSAGVGFRGFDLFVTNTFLALHDHVHDYGFARPSSFGIFSAASTGASSTRSSVSLMAPITTLSAHEFEPQFPVPQRNVDDALLGRLEVHPRHVFELFLEKS